MAAAIWFMLDLRFEDLRGARAMGGEAGVGGGRSCSFGMNTGAGDEGGGVKAAPDIYGLDVE